MRTSFMDGPPPMPVARVRKVEASPYASYAASCRKIFASPKNSRKIFNRFQAMMRLFARIFWCGKWPQINSGHVGSNSDLCQCKVCPRMIQKKKMRQHIGWHITRGNVSADACGFCGLKGKCKTSLTRTSGKGASKTIGVASDCPLFVKFKI